MAITDWELMQAIVDNNTTAFSNMVEHDEQVVERRIGNNTVLRLASRLGSAEMVSLILELQPELVAAENDKSETPIHEACRMGHANMVKLLIEKNQWVAAKLNHDNKNALFVACSYGHFEIAEFFLNNSSWSLNIVDEQLVCISLHQKAKQVWMPLLLFPILLLFVYEESILVGDAAIAKRLLENLPDLAQEHINGLQKWAFGNHNTCLKDGP